MRPRYSAEGSRSADSRPLEASRSVIDHRSPRCVGVDVWRRESNCPRPRGGCDNNDHDNHDNHNDNHDNHDDAASANPYTAANRDL